ncbi:MAG: STAS/SEC14 domain-containing protein [bacterium]|nr:STAS/SEC14 domain-containing protein [bacterium]
MPMIQIEAQLTAGQLLKAVEQMPQEDLDRFVEQVVVLRARQRAPSLSQADSVLMEKISQGLAGQDQQRYDELVARREFEDLTEDQNAEFLRLTNLFEALNVQRMEALAELARIRRSTLRGVMQDLGIVPLEGSMEAPHGSADRGTKTRADA